MNNPHVRGSEWRKWDLHVHAPGTSMNDQYRLSEGEDRWDRFFSIVEGSDVAAIGIADYFTLRTFFEVRDQHRVRYPESEKIFFPNLELRLSDVLNREGQHVHAHLIFRPDLDERTAARFLGNLKTEINTHDRRRISCAELADHQYESSSVTREALETAIKETFGRDCTWSDHLLMITSAKGDGIRSGGSGKQRKDVVVDEIDRLSHGFFGNRQNVNYFLSLDRFEDGSVASVPKPVFGGSDAHSFTELERRLGNEIDQTAERVHVTWVKADLTFDGLQQTLAEPAHRVHLGPTRPDSKPPYKVISRVRFPGSDVFPAEIVLNPNLNSIIGSRSSGKSALLAYIAHAVDPTYTEKQQADATGERDSRNLGPAAGKTWSEVAQIRCEVEWGSPEATSGSVVYIPQNSLYVISDQSSEITRKIAPALFRHFGELGTSFERYESEAAVAKRSLTDATKRWFENARKASDLRLELTKLGDKAAIKAGVDEVDRTIEAKRSASSLTEEDVSKFDFVSSALQQEDARIRRTASEKRAIEPYVDVSDGTYIASTDAIDVRVSHALDVEAFPEALREEIERQVGVAKAGLARSVAELLSAYRNTLEEDSKRAEHDKSVLLDENADLLARHRADGELKDLLLTAEAERKKLQDIDGVEAKLAVQASKAADLLTEIASVTRRLSEAREVFEQDFRAMPRIFDDLTITAEHGFDVATVRSLTEGFNKHQASEFLNKAGDEPLLDIAQVRANIQAFLGALADGTLRVNQGSNAEDLAVAVVSAAEDVRFAAELDGDRIGGFATPTMTPGKRALFALTLILNESEDDWPILLDQPEDDLDSRSIYSTIVPYIIARKKERQILMVSHNANLVVGADSECVIVANRHGDDRPNRDERTFSYLTGSLENSAGSGPASFTLEAQGIRQHTCDILDGGEEAFHKRQTRYKLHGGSLRQPH